METEVGKWKHLWLPKKEYPQRGEIGPFGPCVNQLDCHPVSLIDDHGGWYAVQNN